MGFYNHRTSVWTWAWHSEMSKKNSRKIKKRFAAWIAYLEKEYGKKISVADCDTFLFYLREGSFHARPSTLPILIKLFLLLSKALWIFPLPRGRNEDEPYSTKAGKEALYTEYLALTSIVQTS